MNIIDVTKEDIEYGVPKQADSCPIARALERTFPGYLVNVDSDFINIWCSKTGEYKDFVSTKKIIKFIKTFDKGFSVKPMKFKLIRYI